MKSTSTMNVGNHKAETKTVTLLSKYLSRQDRQDSNNESSEVPSTLHRYPTHTDTIENRCRMHKVLTIQMILCSVMLGQC